MCDRLYDAVLVLRRRMPTITRTVFCFDQLGLPAVLDVARNRRHFSEPGNEALLGAVARPIDAFAKTP